MAVADRAPGRSPLVAVEGLEVAQRFAHLGCIEPRYRIGVAVGALLDVGLQLGQSARPARLGEGGNGEGCQNRRKEGSLHSGPPWVPRIIALSRSAWRAGGGMSIGALAFPAWPSGETA